MFPCDRRTRSAACTEPAGLQAHLARQTRLRHRAGAERSVRRRSARRHHRNRDEFERSSGGVIRGTAAAAEAAENRLHRCRRSPRDVGQSAKVAAAAGRMLTKRSGPSRLAEPRLLPIREMSRQVTPIDVDLPNAVAQRAEPPGPWGDRRLVHSTQKIVEVCTDPDIAGQTNLLALNGQIEAARSRRRRAKGFAVVGQRVKAFAADRQGDRRYSQQIQASREATSSNGRRDPRVGIESGQMNEIRGVDASAVEGAGRRTQEIAEAGMQQARTGKQDVMQTIARRARGVRTGRCGQRRGIESRREG